MAGADAQILEECFTQFEGDDFANVLVVFEDFAEVSSCFYFRLKIRNGSRKQIQQLGYSRNRFIGMHWPPGLSLELSNFRIEQYFCIAGIDLGLTFVMSSS